MDNFSLISKEKENGNNRAVDGLLYGLVGGIAMLVSLLAFALLSGDLPGALLVRFSAGNSTSPIQGLLSHLAVSAIYGLLFGALVWPVLRHISSASWVGWLGGLAYAVLLLLLAQIAILPGVNSPLAQLPFWQWALGHGIYGLVLGGLFSRKVV
jgi:hypothetical protein